LARFNAKDLFRVRVFDGAGLEKFRASPKGGTEILCVVHTQTEIHLAQGA